MFANTFVSHMNQYISNKICYTHCELQIALKFIFWSGNCGYCDDAEWIVTIQLSLIHQKSYLLRYCNKDESAQPVGQDARYPQKRLLYTYNDKNSPL